MTTVDHNTFGCCTPAYARDDPQPNHVGDPLRSCCTTATHDETASAVLDELRTEEAPADVAAIRHAGFTLLFETGEPLTVDALIEHTDVAADRVREIFESVRARGRAEFDDQDRLIGIAGLSLTPGRHEIAVGSETRWTWCALDAVGILGALEATGSVRSTDAQTNETVEIPFNNGRPLTDTHLFILGGFSESNVREDWCPRVNFFGSRQAAETWVSANGLDGDIVAVSEIAAEAAEMSRPVVDLEAEQIC